MGPDNNLTRALDAISDISITGRVTSVKEHFIEAILPGARNGMSVMIGPEGGGTVLAEVISCDGKMAGLLPMASTRGLGAGDEVRSSPALDSFPCGQALVGRVLDPFGEPLDHLDRPKGLTPWPLFRPAPDPMSRPIIDEQLVTGLRCIDSCLSMGKGQRLGLYAGPGAGKSTLLGTLAQRADCDVAVICLVGERGREVSEFVERALGNRGLARSVLIVATADSPAPVRARACTCATAVAEWFCDQGLHVLLLVDSLTRVVRARRDAALSMGEAPGRGGYPASALASLPGLLERSGRSSRGDITAVYAVLTEGQDDPVAEETRALLDGHIVLSERMARSGRWPAVDILKSVSRVMQGIVHPSSLALAEELRRIMGAYERNEDLVLMGAYRKGTCRDTDRAMDLKARIDDFLLQGADEETPLGETRLWLERLLG